MKKLLENKRAVSYFDSVDNLMGITDTLKGENMQIVLCHYPLAEWYRSRNGAWHIYGHIHGEICGSNSVLKHWIIGRNMTLMEEKLRSKTGKIRGV